jgi:hypothetical protein
LIAVVPVPVEAVASVVGGSVASTVEVVEGVSVMITIGVAVLPVSGMESVGISVGALAQAAKTNTINRLTKVTRLIFSPYKLRLIHRFGVNGSDLIRQGYIALLRYD